MTVTTTAATTVPSVPLDSLELAASVSAGESVRRTTAAAVVVVRRVVLVVVLVVVVDVEGLVITQAPARHRPS